MEHKVAALMRQWDRVFGWKRRREALATVLHARSYLREGCTVLDIGCGHGYAIEVLESKLGCLAFGCDVVPAASRIKRFARFDGRNLPFRDKSVDAALLIFVLH